MKKGTFYSQINESARILTKLNIMETRNFYPPYSKYSASLFRNLTYVDTWKFCYKNQYYDFQLVDNSLLQLKALAFNPLSLSYIYYECPYDCPSYQDFLVQLGLNVREVGYELKSDYEEYLATCEIKETVTPVRYDFVPSDYKEGGHPASHLHLGHRGNIRIGTKKILKPLSFVLFVIRQYYPKSWIEFLPMPNAPIWCRNVRANLANVPSKFWNKYDRWEMALT